LHFALFFLAKLGSAHWVAKSDEDDDVADVSVVPVLGVADCELGVDPADDGAAPICADAIVALPISRIAAAAVRPVFLKVISFSS
jgi:hypothetical protein